MRKGKRKVLVWLSIIGGVIGLGGVALAAVSPLLISLSINNGIMGIETNELPKGWFFSGGTFDRSKTNLVTTYSFEATSCSVASAGGTLNSTTGGQFESHLNSGGQVTGYSWNMYVDLAAQQNEYYVHYHCDGTTHIVGCDQAKTVDVTTTAYADNGNCRTYDNDENVEVCASDSDQIALPALRGLDVYDTNCDASCGIGPCVSQCEQDCDDTFDCANGQAGAACREAQQTCKKACVCDCKLQLPDSCPPHEECAE